MRKLHEQVAKAERSLRHMQRRLGRLQTAMIDVIKSRAGQCCTSEDGVSAVEFALVAPILFFALVAAVDVGLAEYERMTIDHIVRAGAQTAMVDPGQPQVLNVVESTAAKHFTVSTESSISAAALKVDVARFCACPDSTSVAVDCSTICTNSAAPFIYYRLSGTKLHNGMIMPAMTLSGSVQVQIR